MKKIVFPVFVAMVLMISACSQKVPFTQGIRDKYRLNEMELKSIQFYTSGIIVLKREEVSEKQKETSEGTLTIKGGSKMEEVVIKANTPCVIEKVFDGNQVSVSFGEGLNKFLIFGSLESRNGFYVLRIIDREGKKPTINYSEKPYLVYTAGNPVFLVCKIKSLNKFEVDQKVVKGKKI